MQSYHSSITNSQLHDQLTRFWELDNLNSSSEHTIEKNVCKQHFLNNVSQTPKSRYVIKLPVKEHLISELRDSKTAALKQFKELEKRFNCESELKTRYSQFINKYLSLCGQLPHSTSIRHPFIYPLLRIQNLEFSFQISCCLASL